MGSATRPRQDKLRFIKRTAWLIKELWMLLSDVLPAAIHKSFRKVHALIYEASLHRLEAFTILHTASGFDRRVVFRYAMTAPVQPLASIVVIVGME